MTLVLIPALAYLVATGLLVHALNRNEGERGTAWRLAAITAIAGHATVHVLDWRQLGGPDLHFVPALSLVAIGMAALTTAWGARGRTSALGVVVFPLAALALAVHAALPRGQVTALPPTLQLHAWLALLSYATLALAALLAVMLWLQERTLRRREFHGWLRVLPPLTELESLLFRTIAVGFALLTATLASGVLFVDDFFAQHLVHKTVLSLLSWLAFGALLAGRRLRGWRGATAVRWTLAAMVLLLLAFFGSKFVLEVVLGRVA